MLSASQMDFFETNGYLVVENVFDAQRVIDPVIVEYHDALEDLIENWVTGNQLSTPPPNADFSDKLIHAYKNGCDYFQPLDISLPTGAVDSDCPFHAGPAVFNLMTDAKMLDVVESLLGNQITSVPIQHVRIKPPAPDLSDGEVRAHITKTNWHQDRAVTLEEADETNMVTVWCAITDATEQNGCLQVIPKSHKAKMQPHCPLPQVGIPDQFIDLETAIPLPVKSGGIILFHPMTVHGSLENHSDDIRWSFDLRYCKTGQNTGRPQFPDFVARDHLHPENELHDPVAWSQSWQSARAKLSADPEDATFYRWSQDAVYCA